MAYNFTTLDFLLQVSSRTVSAGASNFTAPISETQRLFAVVRR